MGGTMIALRGRAAYTSLQKPLGRSVWSLVDSDTLTPPRERRAYIVREDETPPDGFDLYLIPDGGRALENGASAVGLPPILSHLSGGDIVSLSQTGEHIRVLWRHESRQNSVLLTERCDHYCLMCSQPPKRGDDDWLLANAFELVRLLPPTTTGIAFTGGEPTLYGDRLLSLLRLCRNLLPHAGVHVLSNGRRFSDWAFAQGWAAVQNPEMMVGIPIYGADGALHDYVVQSRGAFDTTLRGILNLGYLDQRIEIRVVLHKQTAPYLTEIAEFIARNLPFAEQVALMGLEMIGFARANMDSIWIDPVEYQDQLVEAVRRLDRARIKTMIYNHPLCLLDRELWPFAVQSISDWKNEFHPECSRCAVVDRCAGFFYSAKYRMSDHVKAITPDEVGRDRAVLALAN